MADHNETVLRATHPIPQVCDVSAGSVRMARAPSRERHDEDPELWAMRREEAIHNFFRRLLMPSSERDLKGE